MKSKISVLTIILILVSLYLSYLSIAEYSATNQAKEFYDEQFEKSLENVGPPLNLATMTPSEYEEWNDKNEITRIRDEITNNWNMELYIGWLIRARIHFQMAILSILLTILSWRFDLIKNAKKK